MARKMREIRDNLVKLKRQFRHSCLTSFSLTPEDNLRITIACPETGKPPFSATCDSDIEHDDDMYAIFAELAAAAQKHFFPSSE